MHMAKRGLTPGAPDFDATKLAGASSTVGFLGVESAVSLQAGMKALVVVGLGLVLLSDTPASGYVAAGLVIAATVKLLTVIWDRVK